MGGINLHIGRQPASPAHHRRPARTGMGTPRPPAQRQRQSQPGPSRPLLRARSHLVRHKSTGRFPGRVGPQSSPLLQLDRGAAQLRHLHPPPLLKGTAVAGLACRLVCLPLRRACPAGRRSMVLSCRGHPIRLLPAGYILACALSVVLFFNASRYRVPIIPAMTLFAAWTVFWLAKQAVTHRPAGSPARSPPCQFWPSQSTCRWPPHTTASTSKPTSNTASASSSTAKTTSAVLNVPSAKHWN